MKRYAVESDSPDGRSTYLECWGRFAKSRGRVLAEADEIHQLGNYGPFDLCTWIYDRKKDDYVPASTLRRLGFAVRNDYPRA
jgi:hypothetical protein